MKRRRPRRRWEYLKLLDAAMAAVEQSIDSFNRVGNRYRNEATTILLTNAWELLAKAVLVRRHRSIKGRRAGETIPAEVAVARLQDLRLLNQNQTATVQQVISLRHAAVHHVLPDVPDEVMHHLLFFGVKFFRELVEYVFPAHSKDMTDHYLSLSFADLTTYADKVQRCVSRARRRAGDKQLVWLLERGVAFDGSSYLTEKQVEAKYRGKRKVMPHLQLGGFVRGADMIRIVPVQAPRNYTADVTLRKGSPRDSSLPVVVKKTDVEEDYPYLTKELAKTIGKGQNWTAKAASVLKLKGDPKYHQPVRVSSRHHVHRYSDAALQELRSVLNSTPNFDPYHP